MSVPLSRSFLTVAPTLGYLPVEALLLPLLLLVPFAIITIINRYLPVEVLCLAIREGEHQADKKQQSFSRAIGYLGFRV